MSSPALIRRQVHATIMNAINNSSRIVIVGMTRFIQIKDSGVICAATETLKQTVVVEFEGADIYSVFTCDRDGNGGWLSDEQIAGNPEYAGIVNVWLNR
jgi:hypothetical protein